jgi:putative two-component system response regulator
VCELYRQNQYDLILLDIQMPGMDGFQVIDGLHEIKTVGYLPVLVITAQPSHKLRALKAGARDFISKPFEMPEVLVRVRNMLEVILLQKELICQNDWLEQRVQARTAESREGYLETIFAMTRAAEYKDEDTGSHVQRISFYGRVLACILGMDKD